MKACSALVLTIAAALTILTTSAWADCHWGVDPTTGQYTQVCNGDSGTQPGCSFGVDPTTGQLTQVCQ